MLENVLKTLREGGDTTAILLLVLTALVVLLLLGWIGLLVSVRRQRRMIAALARGMEGRNLEEVLIGHMDTVEQTVRRMEALEQAVGVLQAQMPGCLQRVNMVRFDAFEDVGGEQSFAVAMLDGRGDGIVLTSVYSRMDVRVYAKSIQKGQASHALSKEEERAVRASLSS